MSREPTQKIEKRAGMPPCSTLSKSNRKKNRSLQISLQFEQIECHYDWILWEWNERDIGPARAT